jgi:hypothetical protein
MSSIASLTIKVNGRRLECRAFPDCIKMDVDAHFADGESIELELQNMSMASIISALPKFRFTRTERRNRKEMLKKVATLPMESQSLLRVLAREKRMEKMMNSRFILNDGDCMMDVTSDIELDYGVEVQDTLNNQDINEEEDNFLKPASASVVHQCISEFIDATGNDAVCPHVCMICAREVWANEVRRCSVEDIPNQHLLSPNEYHPRHNLTFGMLLENEVLDRVKGRLYGDVCQECLRALHKNQTPALSLANGMWIGEVPPELAILTLLERVLVAKYFPAAYIVKLFPRQKGASHWSSSGFHSGVKGNVSTYRLNTEDIVDVVDPKVMPPPPEILASVIGVIIVGPKNMPERTMRGYFRVRRDCVCDGLKWLSENNPVYADIEISEARLKYFPLDGVPREILECARYSDDIEQLRRSTAGYVDDDDEIMGDITIGYDAAGMCDSLDG